MGVDVGHDAVTALRSDLAALQYKRDKLISEVSLFRNSLIYYPNSILLNIFSCYFSTYKTT